VKRNTDDSVLRSRRGMRLAIVQGMLGQFRKSFAFVLPLLALSGCGSDDEFTADVSGNYTIALTNGASTCAFDNWEEGKETSGLGLAITQDGQQVRGTLDGVAAFFFDFWFGSADFDGTIKGRAITLANYGENPSQQGNCSFTYNATVRANQNADTIEGTITYSPQTNDNPDCAAVECSASQRFSGSRPPK
jgi:hypothetical protein